MSPKFITDKPLKIDNDRKVCATRPNLLIHFKFLRRVIIVQMAKYLLNKKS